MHLFIILTNAFKSQSEKALMTSPNAPSDADTSHKRRRSYVNETLHLAYCVFQMTHMSNYFLTSDLVHLYLCDASAESWIFWEGICIFIQGKLIVTFYPSEYFLRKVYFKKMISHIQKCEKYSIKFGISYYFLDIFERSFLCSQTQKYCEINSRTRVLY